jgi:predicted nucleic acid-binding protein
MPALVLDASVTLAWALASEAGADLADTVLRRVAEQGAAVPVLWRLEVGNALLMAERRKRIRFERVDSVWRQLAEQPIEIDPDTNARAWTATAFLVRRHGLTLYDAAYLELAVRRCLPLATLDAALARAASDEELPVVAQHRH